MFFHKAIKASRRTALGSQLPKWPRRGVPRGDCQRPLLDAGQSSLKQKAHGSIPIARNGRETEQMFRRVFVIFFSLLVGAICAVRPLSARLSALRMPKQQLITQSRSLVHWSSDLQIGWRYGAPYTLALILLSGWEAAKARWTLPPR